MRNLIKDHLFALISCVNFVIYLLMLVLSLLVNQKWYVSLMMLAGSLIAAGFFCSSSRFEESLPVRLYFIIVFYFIILPASYLIYGAFVSDIPVYFVLGAVVTAVLTEGKIRKILLLLLITADISAVAFVFLNGQGHAPLSVAELLPVYYIRLFLAIIIAGTAGGILMKYRNLLLFEKMQEGEKWEALAEKSNQARDIFSVNVVHEMNKPLNQITEITQMLLDAGSDVSRKEDIFFIDNSAGSLKRAVEELLHQITEHMKDSGKCSEEENESFYSEVLVKINAAIEASSRKNYKVPKKLICPEASVLVVEDNGINLEIIMNMLEQYQCKVVGVQSGMECLDILKEGKIDIVFLDYMMPEMDGIETLAHIRQMPDKIADIPVIALTADIQSGAREMFIRAGFDDYMGKPGELRMLSEMLRKYLNSELIVEVEQ